MRCVARRHVLGVGLLGLAALRGSWAWGQASADTSERFSVYTASHAVADFAARIGANAGVSVVMPLPAGRDASLWRPAIADIAAFQKADLVLLNGAGLESWVQHVSLSRSRVVDLSKGLADRLIVRQDAITHAHGQEGAHSHVGIVPGLWMDFSLAARQAQAVLDAMVARLPGKTSILQANYQRLADDLAALDAQAMPLGKALTAKGGAFAAHPRYDYFAHRYGGPIEALDWALGDMPTPEQWEELDRRRARDGGRTRSLLLWEGEPPAAAQAELARRGLRGVVFHPLMIRPAGLEGDFVTIMTGNLERLRAALA
jgi:zinc transport system substrate-binding protein